MDDGRDLVVTKATFYGDCDVFDRFEEYRPTTRLVVLRNPADTLSSLHRKSWAPNCGGVEAKARAADDWVRRSGLLNNGQDVADPLPMEKRADAVILVEDVWSDDERRRLAALRALVDAGLPQALLQTPRVLKSAVNAKKGTPSHKIFATDTAFSTGNFKGDLPSKPPPTRETYSPDLLTRVRELQPSLSALYARELSRVDLSSPSSPGKKRLLISSLVTTLDHDGSEIGTDRVLSAACPALLALRRAAHQLTFFADPSQTPEADASLQVITHGGRMASDLKAFFTSSGIAVRDVTEDPVLGQWMERQLATSCADIEGFMVDCHAALANHHKAALLWDMRHEANVHVDTDFFLTEPASPVKKLLGDSSSTSSKDATPDVVFPMGLYVSLFFLSLFACVCACVCLGLSLSLRCVRARVRLSKPVVSRSVSVSL